MSFDGQTASTLDVVDIAIPSPRRQPRRPPPRTPSTVEDDLIPSAPAQASNSSIEPMLAPSQAFTVATDAADSLVDDPHPASRRKPANTVPKRRIKSSRPE